MIIFILVMLLFASLALYQFVEKAALEMLAEAHAVDHERLRVEAYSALEVTLATLQDFRVVNGSLRNPGEGWNDPLTYANYTPSDGVTVAVTFDDETGKISLPHADAETLALLFKSFGLQQDDYQKIADAIMGWMKKDYVPLNGTGVSASDYERGTIPYVPAARSLHSFSELKAVEVARNYFYDENGLPTELWYRFVDSVSLFSFQQPNLNSARSGVLSAVGGYDETQSKQAADYINGTGERANYGPALFQNAADALRQMGLPAPRRPMGTDIKALRINIAVTQGQAAFRLSAMIAPPNGATSPPKTPIEKATTTQQQQTSNANTQQANAAARTASQNLNYPFKVLEIRENDQIEARNIPPSDPGKTG